MKTILPFKKTLHLLSLIIFVNTFTFGQTFRGMNFVNPVLESGTYGADNSSYRFSNISNAVDAVVTITGRSDASVVMSNIDTTGGIGYDKAFQPVVGIPGSAPANTTWWMDFSVSLYVSGTMTPVPPSNFYATGLDIDGDNASISEWVEMYKIESIDSALVNSLTFKKLSSSPEGYDYRIEGIVANSPGIDTSAKNVMATYGYANKQTISFRIGATTAGSSSSAAMRLNSIWFQNLVFDMPMPVKLVSFEATLEKKQVELRWTTASEENLDKFVIEKSYDNKNFSQIDVESPRGSLSAKTDYMSVDNLREGSPAIVYYRLRSVDIDGKSEYSGIRIIKNEQESDKLNISAYPNPVVDKLLVTVPSSWQKKQAIFELFTVGGQVTKQFYKISTNQTEILDVNNIARGVYFLRVNCEGKIVQQKIIKN